MKKLFKRLMILGIIGVVLYGGYFFFVKPNGFTDRTVLVNSFITSIEESDTCQTHFNNETIEICEEFTEGLDGKEVVFERGAMRSGKMEINLLIDNEEIVFTVVFNNYEPSGLRSYFNDYYYKIDYIY